MFTLIYHNDYATALPPEDLSGQNEGVSVTNAVHWPVGSFEDAGFYQFNGVNAQISIPFSNLWRDLTFLRIDCEIWIDTHGKRHNVVEGFLSFALYVRSSGVLSATIYSLVDDTSFKDTIAPLPSTPVAPGADVQGSTTFTANLPGTDPEDPDIGGGQTIPPGKKFGWIGVNSDAENAPDGVRRLVPTGEWVKVSFIRGADGFSLLMNGETVGRRPDREALVRSVQGPGVTIGSWPNSNAYTLAGRIRSISIWKYDHQLRFNNFICGVTDAKEKLYLQLLYAKLQQRLRDPETRETLLNILRCIRQAEQAFVTTVRNSSKDARLKADGVFRKYTEIWCAGDSGSEQMALLLDEWNEWMLSEFAEEFFEYQCTVLRCLAPFREIGICSDVAEFSQIEGALSRFSRLARQSYLTAVQSYPCRPGAHASAPDYAPYEDNRGEKR
ncbi:hypothetical protein [uncultured Roseobacter sp.]|uniref:hypothetical protein n=1 Tax=uncultured Roseobacter sp. TaxID=114847 RepID=UPI002604C24B|nr:hypothetical protein [uncultured Roseobacter sp.]